MEKPDPTIERARRIAFYIEELTDSELVMLMQDIYKMEAELSELLVITRDEAQKRGQRKSGKTQRL